MNQLMTWSMVSKDEGKYYWLSLPNKLSMIGRKSLRQVLYIAHYTHILVINCTFVITFHRYFHSIDLRLLLSKNEDGIIYIRFLPY